MLPKDTTNIRDCGIVEIFPPLLFEDIRIAIFTLSGLSPHIQEVLAKMPLFPLNLNRIDLCRSKVVSRIYSLGREHFCTILLMRDEPRYAGVQYNYECKTGLFMKEKLLENCDTDSFYDDLHGFPQ